MRSLEMNDKKKILVLNTLGGENAQKPQPKPQRFKLNMNRKVGKAIQTRGYEVVPFKTLPERVSLPSPFSPKSPHSHLNQETKLNETKTCQNQEVLFHSKDKYETKTNG